MLYALERFNQYAVKENLSAGAILLWHRLYVTMQRRGQFVNVLQQTSVLMAMLSVSRQGLQQMRQMLVDKGFLAISYDEQQHVYYTLMISGKVVGEKQVSDSRTEKGVGADAYIRPCNTSTKSKKQDTLQYCPMGNGPISAQKFAPAASPLTIQFVNVAEQFPLVPKSTPSGDIIITNRYRQYIDAFCSKFGDAMKQDLLQWADMRRRNGWTLTLWGLEAVLKNLLELSAGDAMQMGRIVAQSVRRRWKGFYELKVQAKPSGAKLLQLEAKEQRAQQSNQNRYQKPMQKFAPEGRDLSFLEK